MTSKQQIIVRYTDNLSDLLAVSYYMYYLSSGCDQVSSVMIYDSLAKISKSTGNQKLIESADLSLKGEIKLSYTENDKSSNAPKISFETIHKLFHSLYVSDVLSTYKTLKPTLKNDDKIYTIRSLCNIALGMPRKALEYAVKSKDSLLIFVTAIGNMDFNIAKSYIQQIITSLEKKEKNEYMSVYETVISISMVTFATSTTIESESIIPRVLSKEIHSYEFPLIEEMYGYFIKRDFVSFVKKLPDFSEILKYSFQTSKNASDIINLIKANVIANFLMVYTNFPLNELEKVTGIPNQEAYNLLCRKIMDFTIHGKIDDVNKLYVCENHNEQFYENYSILTRTQIVRDTFQKQQFIKTYNTTIKH